MQKLTLAAFTAAAIAAACGGSGKNSGGVGTGPGTGDTGSDPGTGMGDPCATDPCAGEPAVAQAVGNPREGLIPRALLFGDPERRGVQISPDGKHLSWIAPKDGVANVWVAPVGDLAAAKPVTADTTRPVRSYFWAYDKQHLLYMQDVGGDENFHVLKVKLDGGDAVDLTPFAGARAEVFGVSPRKPGTILVGLNDRNPQIFDVWSIDLASAERTLVYQNEEGFVAFDIDDDYKVRLGSLPSADGGMVVKQKTAKGWVDFEVIPGGDAITTNFLGFDKKATSIYMVDSRDRDTAALVKVDLKSKKKTILHKDARADVAGAMIHPTEKTVQAAMSEWQRRTWTPLDAKVKKDFTAIAKAIPGDTQITSRTLDDKTWVVAAFGDVRSTAYFLWNRTKQQATPLFSAQPALDDQPLSKMHPVVIKARDGLELVSYLTVPLTSDPDGDGKPAEALPMVLFVHGGPWARDSWGFNPFHQLLANRGYAVLSVNYRGSTGFGKDFVNKSNLQWGKAMHDDLVDAVKWAVDGGIAPADKVCIAGGSYGGYATLVGLTMTPDVFACGVDIVGPSSIVTLLESIPPYWAPMIAVFKTRVGDHTTAEGKAALLAVSPLTHVGKIKKPLLIAQGANDPRVKQAEADQIVAAMQAKHLPVTYALFPDEGHGFARQPNSLAFSAITEAFLSAHLGGWYAPITAEELAATSMKIEVGRAGIPGLPAAKQ